MLRSLGETETAAQLFSRCQKKLAPALRLPFLQSKSQSGTTTTAAAATAATAAAAAARSVAVCSWIDVVVLHSTYLRSALLSWLLVSNLTQHPAAHSTAQRQRQRPPKARPGAIILSTRGHLQPATLVEVYRRWAQQHNTSTTSTTSDAAAAHEMSQGAVDDILKHVHIVDCATLQQLIGAVEGLWALLDGNPEVGVVVVEELDAFYWQARASLGQAGSAQFTAHLMSKFEAVQRDFGCGVICGRTSESTRFQRSDPRSHILTLTSPHASFSSSTRFSDYQQRGYRRQHNQHQQHRQHQASSDLGIVVKTRSSDHVYACPEFLKPVAT